MRRLVARPTQAHLPGSNRSNRQLRQQETFAHEGQIVRLGKPAARSPFVLHFVEDSPPVANQPLGNMDQRHDHMVSGRSMAIQQGGYRAAIYLDSQRRHGGLREGVRRTRCVVHPIEFHANGHSNLISPAHTVRAARDSRDTRPSPAHLGALRTPSPLLDAKHTWGTRAPTRPYGLRGHLPEATPRRDKDRRSSRQDRQLPSGACEKTSRWHDRGCRRSGSSPPRQRRLRHPAAAVSGVPLDCRDSGWVVA